MNIMSVLGYCYINLKMGACLPVELTMWLAICNFQEGREAGDWVMAFSHQWPIVYSIMAMQWSFHRNSKELAMVFWVGEHRGDGENDVTMHGSPAPFLHTLPAAPLSIRLSLSYILLEWTINLVWRMFPWVLWATPANSSNPRTRWWY